MGCDNIKSKNIFILSQTEPCEILVRVAIATCTACARGCSHAHNTLILVYISVRVGIATRTCAWLSHAHVYSIQISTKHNTNKNSTDNDNIDNININNLKQQDSTLE